MLSSRSRLLLPMIAAVALAASVTALDWGLPYQWHTDEKVTQAMNVLHSRRLDPDYFINPHLHIYLVAVAFRIASLVHPGRDVARGLPEILPMLNGDTAGRALQFLAMRLARGVSVVCGLATVLVIFALGRRHWDEDTGLLAAAFSAVTMGLVNLWHFATPEALLMLLMLAALGSLDRVMTRGSAAAYAVSGLLIGLACSTKYTACLLAVPFLAAHIAARGRASTSAAALRHVGIATVTAAAGFLAGTPLVIADWREFWTFGVEFNWYTGAPTGSLLDVRRSYGPYLALLGNGLGWPLLALAAAGLAAAVLHAVRERRTPSGRACLVHAVWILSFYGFYGLSPHHALRFIMPIGPSLVLLAAAWSLRVARNHPRRVWRWTAGTSIAGVLIYSSVYTARADDMFLNDTRYAAGRWLDETLTGPPHRLDYFAIEAYLPYFDRPPFGLRFVPFIEEVTLHRSAFWQTARGYLRESDAPIVDSNFYYDRYLDNPRGFPERAELYRHLLTGTDPSGFHPIARFTFENPPWLNPRPERVAPEIVVFAKGGGR